MSTAHIASPSRRCNTSSIPQTFAALSTMASSTGCTSVGERLMMLEHFGRRRLMLQRLAHSRCALASSLNSRTFSMAMTAWSAKVLSSAICLSVEGLNFRAANINNPIGTSLRSSGVARTVRLPVRFWISALRETQSRPPTNRGHVIVCRSTMARPGRELVKRSPRQFLPTCTGPKWPPGTRTSPSTRE